MIPNKNLIYTDEVISFVRARYDGDKVFEDAWEDYKKLPVFNANANIFEQTVSYDAGVQLIARLVTQYFLTLSFQAMRFNLADPNVAEDLKDGNIGTPGRLAKVWVGANLSDSSELGSGRWTKKPRLATFPNTSSSRDIPIIKRVDIVSNCSHHLISFNTLNRPDSYAFIAYIPDDFVLGISKLQRLADWLSRRFWLQEDLTNALYQEISDVAQTESVYIKIINATHGCEQLRGSQSNDGAFSSEMYGGKFKDSEMRKQVDRSI